MTLPTLPTRGPACPPAVDLERASVGDAPSTLTDHLSTCAACSEYVQKLKSETDAFVRARPPERFLEQLEARPTKRPTSFIVGFGFAAALALALVFVVRQPPSAPVLFKGGLVSIAVNRNGTVTTLSSGDVLHAGDALRFSVTAPSAGHAVVINRDGKGRVTVVAPFQASAPQPLNAGVTALDDSAVLDEVAGPERFVTVFSSKTFEIAPLVKQLEQDAVVSCAGCTVETQTFEKR